MFRKRKPKMMWRTLKKSLKELHSACNPFATTKLLHKQNTRENGIWAGMLRGPGTPHNSRPGCCAGGRLFRLR